MARSKVPFPTFIIIGAQKSGTRWLRVNLGRHPDIYTAPLETQFFHSPERFQADGVDWYRGLFTGWADEPIVGEATPGYMMWRHRPRRVASRIAEVAPDARLIALLRNPVDRAHSAMVHFAKRGKVPAGARLLDVVRQRPPERDPLCLVSGGWYAASLRPYRQLFGDQLLVLLHDDLVNDPHGVYEKALLHIGASPDFIPSDVEDVVFSNQQSAAGDPSKGTVGGAGLSEGERQQLYAYFRDDVRVLEQLITRDLSAWDPGGTYSVSLGIDPWSASLHRRSRRAGVDVVRCYEKAATWIEGLVREIAPTQLDLPTPCAEWTVRELLDNLIVLPHECAATLQGVEAPKTDELDPRSGNPADAYRRAADHLLTTMKEPESLDGKVESPFGEMPAMTAARFAFVDQLTHGWDLATATGQDATIQRPLLEVADRIVRRELRIPRMPELFDVEVPIPDDATPTERFVAFLGRDPGTEPVASTSGK